MVIEIMPADTGCHMGCPHCPIRNKNVGSQGHMIEPAFDRLRTLFGRTRYEIDFMTDSFVEILAMVSKFGVPNYTTVGAMMKKAVDVDSLFETLNTLDKLGFSETHIGISNRKTDIAPDTNWLPEFANRLWKEDFKYLQETRFTVSNNTMSMAKLYSTRDEVRANDEKLFALMRESAPYCHRTTNTGYHTDTFGETYYAFLRLQHSGRILDVTHRIIAPTPPHDVIGAYRQQAEIDVYSTHSQFRWSSMVVSLMPIGVRVCHRTTDIHNPFLWFSYPEFMDILAIADDANDFCDAITHGIERKLQADLPFLETYDSISESVIQRIAESARI